MTVVWISLAVAFALYFVLEFRHVRSDGTHVPVHPYRRMMWFIMPRRVDGIVYFDRWVDADPLLDYVKKAKERFPCDVTHVIVAGVNSALFTTPRMNRFVVGKRLWQRKHRAITFSMKRVKKNKKAKLSAVKMVMEDDRESFKAFCERVHGAINRERSGEKTVQDKEYDLFNKLPRILLQLAVPALKTLDYFGILPKSFIDNDPMYTSVFVANLGSLGMSAGYHHLFEWGTASQFVMVGNVQERAVVVDGKVESRNQILVRFSYDERVDDGLNANAGIEHFVEVVENPEQFLGCLREDDERPMVPETDALAKAS